MAFMALTFLFIAAPVLADQPAPAPQEFVDTAVLKARADALRDAVSDQSVSDVAVKSRAYGFFDKLPEERLVIAAGSRRQMDREPVTGKVGSIEGMTAEADLRIAQWKRSHREPPPPALEAAVAQARALQDNKSLSYDGENQLAPNQMGIYKYMRGTIGGGLVKLNDRMKILGILLGNAFTYSTVAHESEHALDHAEGSLSIEQEVAGEIRAFRTQYLWLKLMDPSGERMLTLHAGLKLWMLREPDDKIKFALNEAIVYLEHLSDVVSTNGSADELKKLVEKLGYSDGHKHDHGDEHDREGRGSASPTSA